MIELLASLCADPAALVSDIFERNGFDRPPIVRLVDEDHPAVSRPGNYNNKAASGVNPTTGQEYIWFNKGDLSDCVATAEHEVAHIINTRKNGLKVKMHGQGFARICRQIATKEKRRTCA